MNQSESHTFPRIANGTRAPRLIALAVLVWLATATGTPAQQSKPAHNNNAPAPPRQVKQYTIEQFMGTTRITGSSFSPDEKQLLFASNKTGIFNVYTIPATGGAPQQLTRSTKESTYAVSYFPNDSRFLYTYDSGGNENSHLYVMNPDGTAERDLTPGEKVKANFLGWSFDLKSFYYSTNERDPRYFDVFKMSIADFKPTLLFKNEVGYDLGDISNDEKYLAFVKPNTTNDTDMYLYNTATKEMKHLTPHKKGEISFSPQSFDPASRHLYYLTDEQSEFAYVARYDLASGKTEVVERAPWDVMYTYFSRNGKYRVVATNEDARTRIKIYDQATGKPVALPQLPNGDITGVRISRSERKMAFYLNGDRSPSDLHVYDFATRKVTKLTSSLNPEINPADLADSQVIRYKSFDGMEVPSILYKPHPDERAEQSPRARLGAWRPRRADAHRL